MIGIRREDADMPETAEKLRVRILIYFLDSGVSDGSVTKIARTLGVEKYVISRAISAMEKDNLIHRQGRNLSLTEKGGELAHLYEERLEMITNYLMGEGVDMESASQDAMSWSICSTDHSLEVLRTVREQKRVKAALREQAYFSGTALCKAMREGIYRCSFLIYREEMKNGTHLSQANDVFEHPCTLRMNQGEGTLFLKTKAVTAGNVSLGRSMKVTVRNLQYFHHGYYVKAETKGNIIAIPAKCLKFTNIGSGHLFHGSVPIRMELASSGSTIPETKAVFTLIF